jgi:ATP-dependent RNA helicase DeaD
MGFLDDIEWVLEQTPPTRQVALFSATIPPAIRRIAQRHQRSPVTITIQGKTGTAANIRQRYWLVSGTHKLDALTRILEAESFDAMLIFVRTKLATVELAERLGARGFSVEPLNGDIPQQQRERTVARLKSGEVDIVVATDVAARGLDVERISHVFNYDVPYDSESYIHRIGRTGRAGRSGEAILFIAPRERNMLRIIENATRQQLEQMSLPSIQNVNEARMARFKQRIVAALAADGAATFRPLIEEFEREHNVPAVDIAAALAGLLQGKTPLLLPERPGRAADASAPHEAPAAHKEERAAEKPREREFEPRSRQSRTQAGDVVFETFRVEVGHVHGVKPGNLVGAIANEAGIEGKHIGHVDIRQDHSYVDLPEGMPKEILHSLKRVRAAGQPLRIARVASKPPKYSRKA